MPRAAPLPLNARKTPVQARSALTVEAILQATIQVLLASGRDRLTTTRVAERAGVSVGTLYQYFPNKRALLQAVLKRHLDGIGQAVEQACARHRSNGLLEMGRALAATYLDAKMRDIRTSSALYAVSSDVDGATIHRAATVRMQRAAAALFATAAEGLAKDPDLIATVLFSVLNGAARRALEDKSPSRQLESLREEVLVLVQAYLRICRRDIPAVDS